MRGTPVAALEGTALTRELCGRGIELREQELPPAPGTEARADKAADA